MTRVLLPDSFLRLPLSHRGYHDAAAGRPENSLAAFRAAVEAGYGIELDVQRSADAQAMVFHDDTLDRLADTKGPVISYTAAELGKIHLSGGDETIPTLSEVLALVAGRVPVLVEIKEGWDEMLPTPGLLESAVARALVGYDGPVAVMAFNPHCVAHMARLAPDIPRGMTTESYDPAKNVPIPPETCARLREIPDYDRTSSSFISHQVSDLARPRVAELKSQGAVILCWTVRSAEVEAEARRVADNVTFEGYAPKLSA